MKELEIVAMGTSVADLALGGIITLFTNGEGFRILLDTDLTRFGATGFSSDVLRADRLRAIG